MASEQSITQAITKAKVEVAKAVLMAVREAEDPVESRRTAKVMPRVGQH